MPTPGSDDNKPIRVIVLKASAEAFPPLRPPYVREVFRQVWEDRAFCREGGHMHLSMTMLDLNGAGE
jgi:hypothetical protein